MRRDRMTSSPALNRLAVVRTAGSSRGLLRAAQRSVRPGWLVTTLWACSAATIRVTRTADASAHAQRVLLDVFCQDVLCFCIQVCFSACYVTRN